MTVQLQDVTDARALLWSGRDEAEWESGRRRLAERLAERPVTAAEFAAVAGEWNACERGDGPVRGAIVAADAEAALAALPGARPSAALRRPVALLFPGQGAQHRRMAAGLYGFEPVFTAAMDELFDLLGPDGQEVRADWLAAEPRVPVDEVSRAQPLLLGVGHALARTLIGWGLRPGALLGHSVGETVAAVVAGVFSLEDAVATMRHRVAAAASQPPGGMLAVGAAAEALAPYLRGSVVVGAVNSPRQTVLAGLAAELGAVADDLREAGFMVVPVPSPLGFHSPAVDELARSGLEVLGRVTYSPPGLPLYSAYTCAPLTAEQAGDPWFWARQVAAPVLFWPALDRLLNDGDFLLVEAGPSQGLITACRRHRSVIKKKSDVAAFLPARPGPEEADRAALLTAAARIWTEGHDITPW
ncbi:acyltransferase domain-containing protein [Nonomuraea turcica]|uniref:acyltransferase domain-containing protein n=1 Tax=Nonomuraea sp. G32 TaxID=3067274 RepID=UPI00273B3E76|nr:acyltransferase domain-containing protein [Nonomuraea sp. G32]MDP4503510.1 acyltransferase domain-containing protein [Nonomuraea sp. G32]